uniref:hypothetical protein n=1 Tax=Candidatus Similichlamydia epinepheli TaxID=1903953 RepID=UPI0013009913
PLMQLLLDSIRMNPFRSLLVQSRRIAHEGRVYLQIFSTDIRRESPSIDSMGKLFDDFLNRLQDVEHHIFFEEIHQTLISQYTNKHIPLDKLLEQTLRENLAVYSYSNKKKSLATLSENMTPRSFQAYLEEVQPHTLSIILKNSVQTTHVSRK